MGRDAQRKTQRLEGVPKRKLKDEKKRQKKMGRDAQRKNRKMEKGAKRRWEGEALRKI